MLRPDLIEVNPSITILGVKLSLLKIMIGISST